jgi:acyl-CoA dehydrogenase
VRSNFVTARLGCWGKAEHGIYLILEVLNLSRVANCMGSVALAQRAIADAYSFAARRTPSVNRSSSILCFGGSSRIVCGGCARLPGWLGKLCVCSTRYGRRSRRTRRRYHLFRLVAHLAKYWTAEFAVQTAKWAMEVYGGVGTLQEYRVERWLREAMILAIWEGTSHRQMLDGLEVMQRKGAHTGCCSSILRGKHRRRNCARWKRGWNDNSVCPRSRGKGPGEAF